MACGNEYYLGDLLMAAGFPNIEITSSNRLMAYGCVLAHDVISKRIIVLDDARKGLELETSIEIGLLNLAHQRPEIRQLVFPEAVCATDVQELIKLVAYDPADTSHKPAAKGHLE